MISKRIGMALVACIVLADVHACAADREVLKDPARYVADLRERGLIDATLQRQVLDVLQALVAEAGRWPRGQVNGTYDAQALNVYLVDLSRSRADDLGQPGTLQAFPEQRMILADARYIAALKAATDIYSNDRSVKSGDALVAAITEGPDRAVRSRLGQGGDWRQGTNGLFEGALAFLLAHEMGHVHLGLAVDSSAYERRPRLTGRDRDRAWACASLVGDNVNRRRREESEADAYAMGLLGAIRHPTRRGLRYEFGTVFLKTAELGKVTAALAALSPNADALTRAGGLGVNPATKQAMAETLSRDAGMIETAFPHSHPAQVERLLESVGRLSANPMSAFYQDPDNAGERWMWSALVRATCSSIEGGPAR